MSDVAFKSISKVSELIRNKEISPVELTKQTLQRIEKVNPNINAYITVLEEDAMKQAHILEKEVSEGKIRSPLHGIPISVKDVFDTKGQVTTGGSKIFKDWVSNKDATVIEKLKNAGAVLIGKDNLHDMCWGGTNENIHFGPARNPWNLNMHPGGSSGGSAAAVSAGMSFGALGTDTLGSVRLPSALCGITAIKPTYGRVSRYGNFPFSWTLDHIGPITRNIKDASILLQQIAGYDKKDSTSSQLPVDVMIDDSLEDLKGVVVGVCREYFFEDGDDEAIQLVNKAISQLEELGAEVREISIAGIDRALQSVLDIYQPEGYAFHKPIIDPFPERYEEGIRQDILAGKDITAQQYIDAQRYRSLFTQRLLETMDSIDAIVAPTNASPTFEIGSVPVENMKYEIYKTFRTPLGNLTGFPALTVPCGLVSGNLPIGMQLIGKPFTEKRLMEIANCYENTTSFSTQLEKNTAYEKV